MSFCGYCGYNNETGSTYCPMCGRPMNGTTLDNPLRGRAIASMVLGIVSCALASSLVIGLVTGIIGLNFSTKLKKDPDAYSKNKGFITAGFICSIIGISLSAFYMIFGTIFSIVYLSYFF